MMVGVDVVAVVGERVAAFELGIVCQVFAAVVRSISFDRALGAAHSATCAKT